MTDKEIMETKKYLKYGINCDIFQEPVTSYAKTALWAFEEVDRQKADKERLEIELQAMRNAANSYKSKAKTLEMDNAQLHSDIVNANQNFDHIKGLWEAEKEKVEKAKQKVINVCKELQTAKAEIESKNRQIDELVSFQRFCEAEAIKEFAERLKKKKIDLGRSLIYNEDIDNLVKEMTEQKG